MTIDVNLKWRIKRLHVSRLTFIAPIPDGEVWTVLDTLLNFELEGELAGRKIIVAYEVKQRSCYYDYIIFWQIGDYLPSPSQYEQA